ncbi:hypothetical protein PVAG01_02168 [Phlyctema vagabunda]|uniref:RNase III domain-containing protein n=1 Tax=Phlyctema vagabunda TaxID=108571 RepID=A0ABR4PQH9_9HELO
MLPRTLSRGRTACLFRPKTFNPSTNCSFSIGRVVYSRDTLDAHDLGTSTQKNSHPRISRSLMFLSPEQKFVAMIEEQIGYKFTDSYILLEALDLENMTIEKIKAASVKLHDNSRILIKLNSESRPRCRISIAISQFVEFSLQKRNTFFDIFQQAPTDTMMHVLPRRLGAWDLILPIAILTAVHEDGGYEALGDVQFSLGLQNVGGAVSMAAMTSRVEQSIGSETLKVMSRSLVRELVQDQLLVFSRNYVMPDVQRILKYNFNHPELLWDALHWRTSRKVSSIGFKALDLQLAVSSGANSVASPGTYTAPLAVLARKHGLSGFRRSPPFLYSWKELRRVELYSTQSVTITVGALLGGVYIDGGSKALQAVIEQLGICAPSSSSIRSKANPSMIPLASNLHEKNKHSSRILQLRRNRKMLIFRSTIRPSQPKKQEKQNEATDQRG